MIRRLSCWLFTRHAADLRTALSLGGPPLWECRCGLNLSIHHPDTGQVARLTADRWELVDPEEVGLS